MTHKIYSLLATHSNVAKALFQLTPVITARMVFRAEVNLTLNQL